MNKEIAEAKGFLREAYEKGGITDKAYEDEMNKVKARHEEMLADINSRYSTKEIDEEQRIVKEFTGEYSFIVIYTSFKTFVLI